MSVLQILILILSICSSLRPSEYPIHQAIERGDLPGLTRLLESGENPNTVHPSGETPLHLVSWAAGYSEYISVLLQHNADPDIPYKNTGMTPLFFSLYPLSYNHDASNFKILVAATKDLEQRVLTGKTCLSTAATEGSAEAVALLIKHGADVNSVDTTGNTPLIYAGVNGHLLVVHQLLEAGADPTSVNQAGNTVLVYASARDDEPLTKLLLLALARGSKSFNGDRSPLMYAVELSDSAFFLKILEHSDPNYITDSGWTVLMSAVIGENPYIISDLLKLGVNPNHINNAGETALILAVEQMDIELVHLLSESGADPSLGVRDGKNAAIIAMEKDDQYMLKLLLYHGFNVNATDHAGETPLMHACRNGYILAAQILIEHESTDLSLTNREGLTAEELTESKRIKSIIARVRKQRSSGKLSVPVTKRQSPLIPRRDSFRSREGSSLRRGSFKELTGGVSFEDIPGVEEDSVWKALQQFVQNRERTIVDPLVQRREDQRRKRMRHTEIEMVPLRSKLS